MKSTLLQIWINLFFLEDVLLLYPKILFGFKYLPLIIHFNFNDLGYWLIDVFKINHSKALANRTIFSLIRFGLLTNSILDIWLNKNLFKIYIQILIFYKDPDEASRLVVSNTESSKASFVAFWNSNNFVFRLSIFTVMLVKRDYFSVSTLYCIFLFTVDVVSKEFVKILGLIKAALIVF